VRKGEAMPNRPTNPAKEITGNSGVFTDFMRRLVKVPHSEIKAKLEVEKRKPKRSASRASASSPKRAT
jgi:hypothetical protein